MEEKLFACNSVGHLEAWHSQILVFADGLWLEGIRGGPGHDRKWLLKWISHGSEMDLPQIVRVYYARNWLTEKEMTIMGPSAPKCGDDHWLAVQTGMSTCKLAPLCSIGQEKVYRVAVLIGFSPNPIPHQQCGWGHSKYGCIFCSPTACSPTAPLHPTPTTQQ